MQYKKYHPSISGTDVADYKDERFFQVFGGKTLAKDGVGILSLSGDNTFSGGMEINIGTVVAGHADALGNSGNTVAINKESRVSSGIL